MEMPVEVKEKFIVVYPSGKIDATNSTEFSDSLIKIIEENNNLIINFKDINYISSAGLRAILIVAKKIQGKNGKLVLCEMQPHIYDIFKITGFTQMLKIVPTFQEAEKYIEG